MEKALERAGEILSVGLGSMELPPGVPHRRMVDLARYGMTATATTLRRHGPSRQLATLLATVIYLEGKSVDDCLDLLDLLMTTELIGKAETATDKERARQHPKLARHSATLAVAVETLLEVTEYGEELRLEQVWEAIDAMVPRRELKEAVATVTGMVPPPDADADGQMRALLHPETLLAEHALVLHLALRDVAARLGTEGVDVTVDEEGRLHVARLQAMPEPPSLVDLRKRVAGMLPRVDLPELLLEVMGRVPGFEAAFTSVAGGVSKLSDFHVSVAACLTAQALNIGYAPVIRTGTAALERARLSHVAQNYLSAETFSLANAPLIEEQAKIALPGSSAAAWSPRSTACGSWSRCRPSTPGPTGNFSAARGV